MLTAKQEKFAQAIALEGMNQSDAYRSAYSCARMTDKTIWENASRLMADSKVTARINELRNIASTPKVITAQKRKEWLTEVINDNNADIRVRLQASDQLNRMEGAYVQKVETELKNAKVNINIELSDD